MEIAHAVFHGNIAEASLPRGPVHGTANSEMRKTQSGVFLCAVQSVLPPRGFET